MEGTKRKRRSFSDASTPSSSHSSDDSEDSLKEQDGKLNRRLLSVASSEEMLCCSDGYDGDYNPRLSNTHISSHTSDESDDSLEGHDSCDNDSDYTRNSGILGSVHGKIKCTLLRAGGQRQG